METEPDRRFAMLVQALRLAAAPPERAVALLPEFVAVPDEVADELDIWFRFGPEFVSKGLLTADQLRGIRAIDELLASVSGPAFAEFWSMASFGADERWKQVRRLAHEVLLSMGLSPDLDGLHGITYVQG